MAMQIDVIEGLKVTVQGTELRELCISHADYHESRAAAYQSQVLSMEASKIEGMNYTNGDPIRALNEKKASHTAEADELRFIATHIMLSKQYILCREDLVKLGIARSRY